MVFKTLLTFIPGIPQGVHHILTLHNWIASRINKRLGGFKAPWEGRSKWGSTRTWKKSYTESEERYSQSDGNEARGRTVASVTFPGSVQWIAKCPGWIISALPLSVILSLSLSNAKKPNISEKKNLVQPREGWNSHTDSWPTLCRARPLFDNIF